MLVQAMTCWNQSPLIELLICETPRGVVPFKHGVGGVLIDKYIARLAAKGYCPTRWALFGVVDTLGLLQESSQMLAFTRGK